MTGLRGAVAARFARRMGWGLADQGLSSLTNFAVGIVVARTVGLEDFGAFGLAFAAYVIVAGLSRAITAQPLLIRYSGVPLEQWRRGAAAATGMALLVGLGAVPIAVAIAAASGGAVRSAFIALAIVLPGLVLQDAWRFAFFANARGRLAFINDAIWAAVQMSGLALAASLGASSVDWAVLAWGGGATLAALVGIAQARVMPRPLAARRWWREHRDLLPSYVGEFAAYTLSGQLMLYAIGAIAGLAAVGALRGAQVLLGPIHVVVQGAYLVAVPEAVRLLGSNVRRFTQFCIGAAIGLAIAAVAWTSALLLVSNDVGHALMADVWEPARDVVLVWGISFAAINLGTGGSIGLRALAAATRTVRAATITSLLTFLGAVAGVYVGGVLGAGWGYLLAATAGIAVWWWEFRRGVREHVRTEVDDPSPADDAAAL